MDLLYTAAAAAGGAGVVAGLLLGWLATRARWRRRLADLEAGHQGAREAQDALFAQTAKQLGDSQEDLRRLRDDLDAARGDAGTAREANARLEAELAHQKQVVPQQIATLEKARDQLKDTFNALAAEVLRDSNKEFIRLANEKLGQAQHDATKDFGRRQEAIDELVKPIREALSRVDQKLGEVEHNRVQTGSAIATLLREFNQQQQQLRSETQNLVRALRTPSVRGRWGEVQLRRVVEMAGLIEACDFDPQPTAHTEGGRLRPDLIVTLPGDRRLVVDAKVPLEAYLAALDAPDDQTRAARLADHARHVRAHVEKLAAKQYWEQFEPSPEFVVMFLGAEAIYHAALQEDAELVEFAARRRVLLAGPMSLIGLLLVVAHGWRQERIAHNAEEVSRLGRDLYERVAKMTEHLDTLRTRLDSTVRAFNDTVGSFEGRVLVSARRFKELGAAGGRDIDPMQALDSVPRVLQSANLLGLPDNVVDGETIKDEE